MIRLEKVSYRHPGPKGLQRETLRDISLDIERGEFVALVGPSGCGKTTLLELIAGLRRPTSGRVRVKEKRPHEGFGWAGYLSQEDTLFPWRNVEDNAALGLELQGMGKAERIQRAHALLGRVGLAGVERHYPAELSGGMKKRLGLVRCLAYDPEALLLDEPFGALDAQTRECLHGDLIALWRDFQKTVLFVTHDLVEAIALADRIVLLSAQPTTIVAEHRVALPRPRSVGDAHLLDGFRELHAELREALLREVGELSDAEAPHD